MIKIADRISLLGTETAFAVSNEAAAFAATGNKVYPFHLGDLNFQTPLSIVNATVSALRDGKTGYCPNTGIPALREALANEMNKDRGTNYTIDNVVIQPGGKPTIGKFLMALMNSGDEVLYPNPGYPIYESQIEFHGGKAIPYTYAEGPNGFELDIEFIKEKITSKTRILIINDPQNPTAASLSTEALNELAELVIDNNLMVLSDEAYYDIRYEGQSCSLASFDGMQNRTVILYTFSKKFAMSGWRLGATIGPKEVIDVIAKLNVNDESCTNHFIQYGALVGLLNPTPEPSKMLTILKGRRDIAIEILGTIPGIKCFIPESTFYLFPNVTALMHSKGYTSYESFRKDVLYNTGVSFCTRMHFGRPLPGETSRYIRLAYSGIDARSISEGLGKFKDYMSSKENAPIAKRLMADVV
jgi:aspartate/methionine/tyrosine aminotransferase